MDEDPNLRENFLNHNDDDDLESPRMGFWDRESLPTGAGRDCRPMASLWSTLSNFGFLWIDPMLRKALSRGKLDVEDLPEVPSGLRVASCDSRVRKVWEKSGVHTSTLKVIVRMVSIHRSSLAMILWLRVCGDILNLLGPVLLARLLVSFHVTSFNVFSMSNFGWVSQSKAPFLGNKIFNSGLFLSSFVFKSIIESQLTYKRGILKNSIQSGLITLVFSDNLRRRLQSSSGKVQNLISIDTDRASNILMSWIDIGSMVFQLLGSLILLYVKMRWTCLVGILLVLIMIPVNHFISNTIKRCSIHMMSAKDARASLLVDFMTSIRTVKACHWEPYFTRKISKVREEEVHNLTIIKMFDAVCVFLWAMTSLLMSAGTFGVWSFIGKKLTPQIVYPTISLFNIILVPINALPWVINGLVESYVSLVRLNDFFKDLRMEHSAQGPLLSDRTQFPELDTANQYKLIKIDEAEFSYPTGAVEVRNFCLKVDCLFVGKADSSQNLVTIQGGVGSGKTSLLLSLLHEMVQINGKAINNHEKISFAPQESFLMVGSIKQNILFGNYYDRERYKKIVFACGLDEDFKYLDKGDEFEIHDLSDLCLSGGQRARIMLARALYPRDSTLILVDDLLGCLDPRLSSHIVKYAFSREIIGDKTVLVVTNHPELTFMSSSVLKIESGRVTQIQCTSTETNPSEEIDTGVMESPTAEERDMYHEMVLEEREQGSVSLAAYRYYLHQQKHWIVILLLSLTLMQSSRNYADFWLAEHIGSGSRHNARQGLEQFIQLYFLIVAACGLFTLVRSFSFALGGLKSAVKIHNDLLHAITEWEFSKFLSVSSGQILNRLINDINIIDDALPFILNIFLAQVFGLGGIITVLVISQRANAMLMLPVILLLAWWFLRIQRVYIAGARDMKRIESIYRAPLLSMFQSSGEGCIVIRSFRKEAYFEGHLKHQLELYTRILHASVGLSAWLSLRLQLMSSLIATMIVGFGVFGDKTDNPYFNGYDDSTGLLGLSLSYILGILQYLSGLTTSASEVEREMVSVERVMGYLNSDQEEHIDDHKLEVELEGDIVCHHVSFKYETSWALYDVCLVAPAAKRLAICGRSGSGKSTLMGCIIGMLPVHSGDIFFGGISITKVNVSSLRRSIGYLSQNPIVFSASIRENLDPDTKFDDVVLLGCLRKTGFLQRCLKKLPAETIDEEILDCKPNGLSSAEKSTLSLSRLLLHKPPYLILDEPSSMLNEDDMREILGVLDTEFKLATIIESVHKLQRATSADLVAIFNNGMVLEMGPPNDLQRKQDSEFNRMLEGHQERV